MPAKRKKPSITVVGGAGYVGLVTAVGFAELGFKVIATDPNTARVDGLNKGKSPIYEPGIEELIKRNVKAKRLSFTTKNTPAIKTADVIFVAVGTPSRNDGHADISAICEVAEEIATEMKGYTVIVNKSTVPVGTIELFTDILSRKRVQGKDFDIVSNPEFLQEGKGMYDFFNPTRIIIGTDSRIAAKKIEELHQSVIERDCKYCEGKKKVPVVKTDIKSAQLIKHASNAFLANKLSFMNEIAMVAENVGADVQEVIKGMSHDPRIGSSYMSPGIGFGGPCLEKDLKALIRSSENVGYDPRFLHAVLDKNEDQVLSIVTKIKSAIGYPFFKKQVAIWGLTFNPGTNDVRNSLSLRIIDQLVNDGVDLTLHDPMGIDEAKQIYPDYNYFSDPYKSVSGAHALALLTDWPEYKEIDFGKVKNLMHQPIIIDGKNLYNPSDIKNAGFEYIGVGRS